MRDPNTTSRLDDPRTVGRRPAFRGRGFALGVALLGVSALASAAADGPLAAVEATLSRTSGVLLGTGTRDEKLSALDALASDLLDTDAIGRSAIGSTLASRSSAEQKEFLRLFDRVIVRAYLQKLLLFRNPRFSYVGERIDGQRATVRTLIVTSRDEFSIDYPMRYSAGRWKATDILVEGISLAGNYRAQFDSLLRRLSFDQLLERMRRKVERYRRAEPA